MLGGAATGAAVGKAARVRIDGGQNAGEVIFGTAADVTEVSSVFSGLTNQDIVTNEYLGLSTEERGGRFGSGVFQVGLTTVGIGSMTQNGRFGFSSTPTPTVCPTGTVSAVSPALAGSRIVVVVPEMVIGATASNAAINTYMSSGDDSSTGSGSGSSENGKPFDQLTDAEQSKVLDEVARHAAEDSGHFPNKAVARQVIDKTIAGAERKGSWFRGRSGKVRYHDKGITVVINRNGQGSAFSDPKRATFGNEALRDPPDF